MSPRKKTFALAFALLMGLSTFAASADAAGRYGPAGLGSNLHRRFILKQAQKDIRAGRPVRGRATIWLTRPSSSIYRAVPGYRR